MAAFINPHSPVTMNAKRKPASPIPENNCSTAFPSLHEGRVPANDPHADDMREFRTTANVTLLLAAMCGLLAVLGLGYACFRAGVAYSADVASAAALIGQAFGSQPLIYGACIVAFAVLLGLILLERAYMARLRDEFAIAEPLSPTRYSMSVALAEHLTGRSVPASYLEQAADPASLSKFWADADARLRYLRADAALRARRTKPRTA